MDSVKLWDLERPWLQDIIMKPQSLIYDMRGNSEYFYSNILFADWWLSGWVFCFQLVCYPLLNIDERLKP